MLTYNPDHSTKMHLTYFAHRGRGDVYELLCTVGRQPVDLIVTRVNWNHFLTMRESGLHGFRLPYQQLPVLLITNTAGKDRIVAQTNSIITYTAKIVGEYPSDEIHAAVAESVINRLSDLSSIGWYQCKTDKERAQFLSTLVSTRLPPILTDLESMIATNTSDSQEATLNLDSIWIVGETRTFADLAIFAALHELWSMGAAITSCGL
ncbi:hypothetical protein SARC_08284 [Sphaeroforma arctica JP610]|uniref:GST N-terminal domain-containing protein n=1 Tax=Sphaeroforma arctica JP610 TaxID=667725 RepID=A0A0L0FRK2_9EUKA|nr:hypothetical protein SARC_08284 [Sphaeroforma arctica JP610]KNC79319.1 hypothetical protein SARC_08284 [Sphaeroforma arctica JP610]|eukprot:XP_014153221.1 hypothetical protein SARC_08284 [Sphaeroforma arctica JP610]